MMIDEYREKRKIYDALIVISKFFGNNILEIGNYLSNSNGERFKKITLLIDDVHRFELSFDVEQIQKRNFNS